MVASHFKLKKSTDKALVCLYEIYFICVINLINWGLFCCLTYFNFTKKCAAFYLTINKWTPFNFFVLNFVKVFFAEKIIS